MYKDPTQFMSDLQQELEERSSVQLLDLVVVVPKARDSIGEIASIFKELELDGEGCLAIDGSYKFVMKSALHGSICSGMLHMLSNKIVAQSLVQLQRPPKLKLNITPNQTIFKPTDAGLLDSLLLLLCGLTGDTHYPTLVVKSGVSQKTSDFIYASLLPAREPGMPINTILAADLQIGTHNDEIQLSRFDLHYFDFSLENLKHILHGLPASEDANNILKKKCLMWAIKNKTSRCIAYLGSLSILIRETIALYSVLDQPGTPDEVQARENAVRRIRQQVGEILSNLDFKWTARALFGDADLKCWLHFYDKLQSLGNHSTLLRQIEQTKLRFEAELHNISVSRNINRETATQQVINLVLDTHQTYHLHDLENQCQGFRIPVSSILSIPTEQEWIDVTGTSPKMLFRTADFHVGLLEGSITSMVVHKHGVKKHYQNEFLKLARDDSKGQTLEELFAEKDSIDTNTCVRFVSTEAIISYLIDQGVQLNRSTSRVAVVSKLLDIYSEGNEVDFRLNCSTMECFHAHRRTEIAVNILDRSGQNGGQDPWASLQDFVRRQGETILKLPLKYFSNDGLIKLHRMHRLVHGESERREDLVRTLAFQATSLNPDTQDGEDEPMDELQWIDDVIAILPPCRLDRTQAVALLEGVTDPQQQRKIIEAANEDPRSIAMLLAFCPNLEELLNELNLV